MADNKTSWVFDLDVNSASKKLFQIQGQIDELGKADSLKGLAEKLGGMVGTLGLVAGAFMALKTTINLALDGEAIEKYNNQFDILSKNAGIAGDVMKEKLIGAAGGLADDTDIIKAANEALVKLGSNAEKLPQVMELARKVTSVYGGDLTENFQNIANGIANGNARMLKQYGLVIDNEKALTSYAKSIGTTVDSLSEAGRQQALMNAALEKGEKAFDGIKSGSDSTATAYTKMKVAFNDLYDTMATLVSKSGIVKDSFNFISIAASDLSKALKIDVKDGSSAAEQKLSDLNRQLEEMQKNLDMAKSGQSQGWISAIFGGPDIALIEKRIESLKQRVIETTQERDRLLSEEAKKESPDDIKPKQNLVDQEAKLRQESEFQKSLQQMKKASLDLEEKNAISIEEADALHAQRRLQIQADYEAQKQMLEAQVAAGKLTPEQANQLEIELYTQRTQRLIQIDDELDRKRMESLERYAERNKEVSRGFGAGWQVETQKAIKANANFAAMGQKVFGVLTTRLGQAFKAMGDGSKDASEAMKGFVFSALGDIATMKGEVMLAEGVGTMNPLLIGQGGALIALGSMISSMAGGGASSAGGGGGGGGGMSGAGGGSSALTGDYENKPEVKEPKKAVNVNIHGSIYETEQTKTRLMEMIREVSDATDFNFNKIGQ